MSDFNFKSEKIQFNIFILYKDVGLIINAVVPRIARRKSFSTTTTIRHDYFGPIDDVTDETHPLVDDTLVFGEYKSFSELKHHA